LESKDIGALAFGVLWLDRWFWGHGESLSRLTSSTFVCLALLTFIRWFNEATGPIEDMTLGQLAIAASDTWWLYLDFPSAPSNTNAAWSSAVLLLRYLTIGLFISVLFRKLSKR